MGIVDRVINFLVIAIIVIFVMMAVAAALSFLAVIATILIAIGSAIAYYYPFVHNLLSRITQRAFESVEASPIRVPIISGLLSLYALFSITFWFLALSLDGCLLLQLCRSVGYVCPQNTFTALIFLSLLIAVPLGASLAMFPELDTPGGGPIARILERFRR
jgi:hypothetical protein